MIVVICPGALKVIFGPIRVRLFFEISWDGQLSNDTARDLLDFLDQSTYAFQERLEKSFQNQIAKSAGFTVTGLDVSLSDTPEIPASTFWDVFSVYRQADSIRLQHKALGFTLSRSSILILLMCSQLYTRRNIQLHQNRQGCSHSRFNVAPIRFFLALVIRKRQLNNP